MPKYTVAICPHCGEIQAFYYRYKRKRCIRCGRMFRVSNARILGVFNDAYTASEYTKQYKLRRGEHHGENRRG